MVLVATPFPDKGTDCACTDDAATVAVVGRVPMETLWHAVPSYPTASEIWLRLLESRQP